MDKPGQNPQNGRIMAMGTLVLNDKKRTKILALGKGSIMTM
jgi:hypothetical protein